MSQIEIKNSSNTMTELKSRLKDILGLFDTNSSIYYVDYPIHSNIGDLLINLGTEEFFNDHRIPILERYNVLNIKRLSASPKDDNVTFLCHGGGNLGDIYVEHEDLRNHLLNNFPKARIVFLPQTLYYSSKEKEREALRTIAQHPNCHVLVRDEESLNILRDANVTQSSMMPDMAHQLWGVFKTSERKSGGGNDIYFVRRDREAVPIPLEFRQKFGDDHIDWNDIISIPHKALIASTEHMLRLGTSVIPPNASAAFWYSVRDTAIDDAATYFAHHEHVYTNRLHAMLLALLLKKDVTIFDNSYKKLSRYINAWLTPITQ